MKEQKNMEKLYILCGLNGENEDVREAIVDAAYELGYEAICVSRYRKEGIEQYISEHPEFRVLVLQEVMQNNYPYSAEELAALADNYHLKIVISLNKAHRADKYMKILYTAGILDALYEEDATAENILHRIISPRTRRESRGYYQITTATDAMSSLDIVDEKKMKGYLEYLEESYSDDEVMEKYHYIASSLKIVENIYITEHLSERIRKVLASDKEYQETIKLKEKKKRKFFGRERALAGRGVKEVINTVEFPKKGKEPLIQTPKIEEVVPVLEEADINVMIDEDISDLLGFAKRESSVDTRNVMPIQNVENIAEVREVLQKKRGDNKVFKIGIWIFGFLFMAMVILFGFFLYFENQTREKSLPTISISQLDDEKKKEVELPESNNQEDELSEEYVNEEITELDNDIVDDVLLLDPASDVMSLPNLSNLVDNQSPRNQGVGNGLFASVDYSMHQPLEISYVTIEESAIDSGYNEEPFSLITIEETLEKRYQGKIFTGEEVIAIAHLEEKRGYKLSLQTRKLIKEKIRAEVLAQLVDERCSYLAQEKMNTHLAFVQQ